MSEHPFKIFVLICSVNHDKIAVFPDFIYDQIIHHAAFLITHRAIPGLPVIHPRKVVGQQSIQISQGSFPLAKDFSHVRHIKQPAPGSHSHMLLNNPCFFILYRQQKTGKRNHFPSVLHMRVIQRSPAFFHWHYTPSFSHSSFQNVIPGSVGTQKGI